MTQKLTMANGTEVRSGITKYERYENGQPAYGSVSDPRMGTLDKHAGRCRTCQCEYTGSGTKINDCPGHFGHIELMRPVFHVGYMDHVVKVLRCVCFHCSRLLIDRQTHKAKRVLLIKDPETRMRHIHELCRAKRRCETTEQEEADEKNMDAFLRNLGVDQDLDEFSSSPGCGGLVPKYSRKGLGITVEFPSAMEDIPGNGEKKQILSTQKAFEILRSISDKDAIALGFDPKWTRPEWLLITILPVPPPHVRPPVEMDGVVTEDDLSSQLINVVKTNTTLEAALKRGDPPHIIGKSCLNATWLNI